MKPIKKQKNKRGFTLIEVLSVILFISLLIGSGLYVIDFSSKRDSVNLVLFDKFIYRDMPQALLQAYYTKNNTFTSMVASDITNSGDVGTTTYNDGYTWSVDSASANNKIIISIDAGDNTKAQELDNRINKIGNINSVTVDGANIKVTYEI